MVNTLLGSGKAPLEIMTDGLLGGMDIVGERFQSGELFIPELLRSAQAVKEGLDIVKPLIVGDATPLSGKKVVMGTVEGDAHSIGKSIVGMLFEAEGLEVIDIGVDVPAAKFVEAVKQEQPKILGLSALMSTAIMRMKEVIDALEEAGLRQKVTVMIGGAATTQGFADSIGADGYAPDGPSAVGKVKELIG